ncbi:hypothetical protein Pcinc_008085 [Petrolisthes cinctipes]|uniref:Uncharacterized protein n=1 Tax=Petrolisthes cinctipes TaxID=88211 RepID=A0AAE1G9W1_PETCI|nr:hypothetical protein Pcinc_008085 [Petrolisthes cinctipes]
MTTGEGESEEGVVVCVARTRVLNLLEHVWEGKSTGDVVNGPCIGARGGIEKKGGEGRFEVVVTRGLRCCR